jgi:hypothetical protein
VTIHPLGDTGALASAGAGITEMLIQGNQLLTSPGAQPAMTSLTSAMPLRAQSGACPRPDGHDGHDDTVKPTEPIERTGPSEQIDSVEFSDLHDHRDPSFDDIGSA